MKKHCLALLLVLGAACSQAQIQVSKFLGENKNDYKVGFGGFLKFSYPIMESADLSLEAGVNLFQEKYNTDFIVATLPVKLGYRYIFSKIRSWLLC